MKPASRPIDLGPFPKQSTIAIYKTDHPQYATLDSNQNETGIISKTKPGAIHKSVINNKFKPGLYPISN